jgi:AraC-like DNA-binding protein
MGYIAYFDEVRRESEFYPAVNGIGYFQSHIQPGRRTTYRSIDVGLILSGSGAEVNMTANGVRRVCPAPAFRMFFPGVSYSEEPWGPVEILYFCWEAEAEGYFRKMGFTRETPFPLPLELTPAIRMIKRAALALIHSAGERGAADRADRLGEMLLLELSLQLRQKNALSRPGDDRIRKIASFLRARFTGKIDLPELLKKHGLTERAFYRGWRRVYGDAAGPAEMVETLRINQARRLLTETDMRVGEAARAAGFDDPLYFSRRFRLKTGESPSDCRRRQQI